MKNTCENCRWQYEGTCRVNPPSVQLLMANSIQGPVPQPFAFHPPVMMGNFCSKHQRHLSSSAELSDIVNILTVEVRNE